MPHPFIPYFYFPSLVRMFLLNQWATDVFYKGLQKGGYQHFYWLSWFSIATLWSLRTETTAGRQQAGWPRWHGPCAQDGGEWHRIARDPTSSPLAPHNCFKTLLQNLMLWIHQGSVTLEVFPSPTRDPPWIGCPKRTNSPCSLTFATQMSRAHGQKSLQFPFGNILLRTIFFFLGDWISWAFSYCRPWIWAK